MLEESVKTVSTKKSNINICNMNIELLQTYEVMQIKLQNIIQGNEVLKKRFHYLKFIG